MAKSVKVFILLSFIFCNQFLFAQQNSQQQGKLDYALQLLKSQYVDTVNEKRLSDDALKAMIKDLDPHSAYIPSEEMRAMNEPLVGKFDGIGIQFNIHEDTIMVTATIPGGPSEKLGIRAGDRIVKVDGVNKSGVKITNNDVLKLLRGDKGTKVTVSIYRRGNTDLIDYTITRDQIPLFSLDASYIVAPKIGYIKISRFADSTVDEFQKALANLKKEGIESLILDLQDNGGGYLNRAVELADEFISEGKKIVFTKGRISAQENYESTSIGGWEKGKLAILINENSASASEIVSGAVQDWDRGLIVGRRSFGKGLVQKPYSFPDGSMIRLTVAHYYTPSGRCIQKPYVLGDEDEYDNDYSNRRKHGELFSADSVHFSDSTNYFTSNKRVVHGGGGIMPDVFVPLDTTPFSNYFSDLFRKNVFSDFVLTYVDNNRTQLKKDYSDLSSFRKNFIVQQQFFDDFVTFAEKQGVKDSVATISENAKTTEGQQVVMQTKKADADEKAASKPAVSGLKTSEQLIRTELKALIARELWSIEGFEEVINDLNTSLKKAIDAINDNTFEKSKIAVK